MLVWVNEGFVCVCVCLYEWVSVLCVWGVVCVCLCVCVHVHFILYNKKKTGAVPLWHLWVQPGGPAVGHQAMATLKKSKKNSQKSPPYSDVVIQWIGLVWFLRIFLRCHFWLLRNLLICDVVQLMCLVLTFEGKKIQRLIPGAFSLLAQLLAPCCSPLVCRMRNFFSYFPSWLNCFFLMQPTRVQYEESKFSFYFPLLVKIILYGISYTFVK